MHLTVQSPDELIAAVPHMLGFKPEESILMIPFGPGLPVVRVDLPTTAEDRDELWDVLHEALNRHSRPDSRVAVVCLTEDRRSAELASQHLSQHLETIGVTTQLRLWADGQRWVEFDSGAAGMLTQESADRVAASTVVAGTAQPAASRASLAASLVGNREPITAVLPSARQASEAMSPTLEQDWALDRLEEFHTDGNRLSDADSARILVAMETISTP